MNWLTNEMLFYGGSILTGTAVLLSIVFLCVSKVNDIKLNERLNKEYGEKENGKNF